VDSGDRAPRARSPLLELWFGREFVPPGLYAATGFALSLIKYALDASIVYLATGQWWTPLDYVRPILTHRLEADAGIGTGIGGRLMGALLLLALPFLWIGVSMTARRLRDAGLSAAWTLVFFVPYLNYLFLVLLCVLPTRSPSARAVAERSSATSHAPRDGSRLRFLGSALAGTLVAPLLMFVNVFGLGAYTASLFVGAPFVIGVVAAYLHACSGPSTFRGSFFAGRLSLVLSAAWLIGFALEGLLCLLMAWPLAAAICVPGILLGRALGRERDDLHVGHSALAVLALFTTSGLESTVEPPEREVVSVIEIDAPPEVVWRNVIGFSEIPPPEEWIFRAGIAHPLRAVIHGEGVGAERHCEFSTGAFVEPITVWNEPERLSFGVTAQPEPMEEWSPYREVYAPHLVDGLVVSRGEFRLVRLPGGRTRLEGSTWYRVDLGPELYWSRWSDFLIHRIHLRVLRHIARLSEYDVAANR